jgi:hypothetical protein
LNAFQAFSVVFQKAIEKAVPAGDVSTRVVNLIDCITYSVFMYTSRGLFERDKLIFSSQMAFQASLLLHTRKYKIVDNLKLHLLKISHYNSDYIHPPIIRKQYYDHSI